MLERGIASIKKQLKRLVRKGEMDTDAAAEIASRVRPETTLDAMKGVDFVIEAVTENEEVKKSIFQKLDALTPVHAILASNTSSISITKLGAATNKPHRVVRR